MGRGEAHALDASYFMHGFQQLHERRLDVCAREFATPVKIDDLP